MTYTAAVITISDKGSQGLREDTSGPNLVRILKEKGFIRQEAYSGIELTDAGKEMAQMILNRHNTIRTFLEEVLGVSSENAEHDACKIEHIISEETFEKISTYKK